MGNQPTRQISNQTGKQKKYVHWKSAEVPSAPGRPILIPVSEQQPDAITLQWDKSQSDGGSPILGYVVEHRRVGATNWTRSIPILIVKTEAAIVGLEPGWKYQFRIIAENVVGRSQPSILSDPFPISLQIRNTNTLPKFINELKDTNSIENERLEMKVRVFGNPQPEISWFKDGFEIFSSRRIKILNENDFSSLIIHQVALTDEGEIKCTATNRAGHVATKAKLIVEAPPKIRLPRNYEDGLIIEEDDTLKLKAGIAGQPFPAVIWSREGKVISNGNKFEISITDKHTLLKIGKVKRIDRGEYSIRAINKLGEDIASFLVTVTAKPRSPGKVKIMQSNDTSVTLAWTEPEDDGGCKIGSYIVEYFRIGWDVWLKATTTRRLQTTLNDLIEGSEYKFRVKAENPYGVSEPSPESDILYIKNLSTQQGTKETPNTNSENMKLIPPPKASRKATEQSKSPVRTTSPSIKHKRPEIFESEQLNMEMSYGAPANAIENSSLTTSKVTKSKEDRATSPKPMSILKQRSPIPTPRKNNNNLTLEMDKNLSSEKLQRSPSPKIEITVPDEKQDASEQNLLQTAKSQEKQISLDTVQKENLISLNIRRSISPKKPSESQHGKVSPSFLSETDQKIAERLMIEREKELEKEREKEMKSYKYKKLSPDIALKQNGNVLQKTESEVVMKKSFDYLFNKMNNIEENNQSVEKNETERYEKTEQLTQILHEPIKTDLHDQQLSSDAEGKHKDEVHTSNEYMLVFYPDGRNKEIEEPESRNYYAADNQGPPVLSYSFPNLSTLDEFSFQANIRRSASSTELLYEKAMARFYEAVEMEEERKEKKKATHLGEHLTAQKNTLQNLDSIAESQEISNYNQERKQEIVDDSKVLQENNNYLAQDIFEQYKNSINVSENRNTVESTQPQKEIEHIPPPMVSPVNRRDLTEMVENQHVMSPVNNRQLRQYEDSMDLVDEDNLEAYDNSYKHFSDAEVRENTLKNSLFDDEKDLGLEYGSDYTDSTASESESSMEYFKREVITRSSSGGIGRKKVTLSPVRYESSEDDTFSHKSNLTSVPAPKSILKKPQSNENVVNPVLKTNVRPLSDFNTNEEPQIVTEPKQNMVLNLNFVNVDSTAHIITNTDQIPKQAIISNSTSNPNINLDSPKLSQNIDQNQKLIDNESSYPNPNSNPKETSNNYQNPKISSKNNPNPNYSGNLNLSPNPKLKSSSNPNESKYLNPDDGRRKSEDLRENPKLSPLSKAKSISDRKLKGLKSFLTGGRSKSSKEKNQSLEKIEPSKSDIPQVKTTPPKPTEPIKDEKKEVKVEPDEGARVIVDYYSNIVQELGHSKYKTPLYLNTDELKKQSERADIEESVFRRNSEIDAEEDLLLLQHKTKPRMSIVERMQAKHVRPEKSSHCIENTIAISAPPVPDTPEVEAPSKPNDMDLPTPTSSTGKKIIKTKKIIKRTARSKSRDPSKTRGTGTIISNAPPSILINETELERLHSLHKNASGIENEEEENSLLKHYMKSDEKENENKKEIVQYDVDDVNAEAQDNVHSAISYVTDLGLFVFACWVYLFKDAYMVLPILALMVYRRIGEAISRNLPSFLKKKPC
ncbi:titin homolog [Condylostylus longicornis]|uniref:titin homolog n=1 Tax=Condylostylus longicornis TaxID=2530218 RepID=UPI00244E021A|nr:titin homolog [Condylostylus longicornis]XP_055378733.1 titin homolog [Condylostylus longicornis]